ncbi:MAG: DNA-directed RNA polymerase subunit omega [Ignavibacteriales bacterium]|nr:DNA-directed RNA polymerase subunit omega [Ignavibacteriales bacterium]
MAVKPIDIQQVNPDVGGIYEAIIVAARRARQIHNDIRIELNQQLETLAQLTTTVDPEEEVDVSANPDQLKISLEFEKRPKATEYALDELMQGKLEWRRKEEEQPVEKEAPEPDDAE